MKKIYINSKKYGIKEVLIDNDDYQILLKHKWCIHKSYNTETFYVCRNYKGKTILLHREILKINDMIDHINGNGLDNRKKNLRSCNKQTNGHNKKIPSNNTSGYKGVSLDSRYNKWKAYIRTLDGRVKGLGYYICKRDAAKAYNNAAIKYFGKFAKLNII